MFRGAFFIAEVGVRERAMRDAAAARLAMLVRAALDRFQNIVMVEGDDADISAELVQVARRFEQFDA